MQPTSVQEHAGEDRHPWRDRREVRREPGGTEYHSRDHPVGGGDRIVVLAQLPQEDKGASRDQRVGDIWSPADRIVVVERQEEEHRESYRPRGELFTCRQAPAVDSTVRPCCAWGCARRAGPAGRRSPPPSSPPPCAPDRATWRSRYRP